MLTIVTTTRNRPLCFSILENWVSRQTVKPDQWLVVNDGTTPYAYNHNQEVLKRKPKTVPAQDPDTGEFIRGERRPDPKEISILANWLKALPKIRGDKVIVCEDDDWYHPAYLETMSKLLDEVDVVGVAGDLYFKLRDRKFIRMHNAGHASLGATAFRASVLPQVERCCKILCPANRSVFIDLYLWAEAEPLHGLKTLLIPNKAPDGRAWHVGMKQMPGARGLGIGHSQDGSSDPTFNILTQWVGMADSRVYRSIPKAAWGSS